MSFVAAFMLAVMVSVVVFFGWVMPYKPTAQWVE